MDAGEADAEILIEGMAHFRDHLIDEDHAALFFFNLRREVFAHFEDHGKGQGVLIGTAFDDGMSFHVGGHSGGSEGCGGFRSRLAGVIPSSEGDAAEAKTNDHEGDLGEAWD